MTEMQPTEIELTGKKKKSASVSKRKIFAFCALIVVIALIVVFTAILAHRASRSPQMIQTQGQATVLPAETTAPAAHTASP